MIQHMGFSAIALCVSAGFTAWAQAQQYPQRPVRVIVAFAAGGVADLQTRVVAQKLGELWQTSVVVDNRPGAGGSIGAEIVARAKPDGYTLLAATNSPFTINPVISKVGYDPLRDFEPVKIGRAHV